MSEVVQGTEEWHAARRGKLTASRIADMMARTKTGYAASRENYRAQLVVERLTGETPDGFTNAAMRWGTETEPMARAAYSFWADADVVEVGFIDHPTLEWAGASPDGLVGDDGLVEIKCPESKTHIATLRGGAIPDKYVKQMQWQMACTGRKWCDFVSFDPRLPVPMQMHVTRLRRDDEIIAQIEAEAVVFLAEIETECADLRARYPEAA